MPLPCLQIFYQNFMCDTFSCYMCAQMGRQTGRGMEGRDKNV